MSHDLETLIVSTLVASMFAFFTALLSWVTGWLNARAIAYNTAKTEALHESVNGKMDKLLEVTHEAGVLLGKSDPNAKP